MDAHTRTFLLEEYRQIGESVRTGWELIFSFFRHFIVIQIILISFIGFQGKQARLINPFAQEVQVLSTTIEDSKPQGNYPSEKNINNDTSTGQVALQKIFLKALAIAGFTISIGGVYHTQRLMTNSKAFVDRGRTIEKKFYTADDLKLAHFNYMYNRILESTLAQSALYGFYLAVALGWLAFIFTRVTFTL